MSINRIKIDKTLDSRSFKMAGGILISETLLEAENIPL